MTSISELALTLHGDPDARSRYEEDPHEFLESLPEEERAELTAGLNAVADLVNRILADPEFAESFKESVIGDPGGTLADHGIPITLFGPTLEFLGAPRDLSERLEGPEFLVPAIPLVIGALRATQVAVKVAPRVHAGVKNVAPYIGVPAGLNALFN